MSINYVKLIEFDQMSKTKTLIYLLIRKLLLLN